jgi:hypothetical protein
VSYQAKPVQVTVLPKGGSPDGVRGAGRGGRVTVGKEGRQAAGKQGRPFPVPTVLSAVTQGLQLLLYPTGLASLSVLRVAAVLQLAGRGSWL